MTSIDDSVEMYAIIDSAGINAIRRSVNEIILLYKMFGSAAERMNLAKVSLKSAYLKHLNEDSSYLIFKDNKLVRSIGPSEVKELSAYGKTLRLRSPCEEKFIETLDFYRISSIELLNEKELAKY